MTATVRSQASLSCSARPDIRELNSLAAAGLTPMFDPKTQLFCHRLKLGPEGLAREGTSHRYTVMSLLGLHRYETTGGVSPIEIGTALDSLFRDYSWVDNIGDAGLLLWLAALAAPERLSGLCSGLHVESALARFQGAREGRTMELAWFLAGLSHVALAKSEQLPKLEGLAMATFESLKRNQGRHGIFGHQAAGRSVGGVLRGRIGSFADQVYPIYALTRFAQAYAISPAFDLARRCADAICHAQGELGQWWWHYDGSSGRVFQKYPVYSVHQHGMAPMALLALGEATGSDYSGPVHRGLAWIDREQ